jgi:hypothetical protein
MIIRKNSFREEALTEVLTKRLAEEGFREEKRTREALYI